jgi:recombination protein RecA
MDKERMARLKKICDAVNSSEFGGDNKDALTFVGSDEVRAIQRWPSGCPDLDVALGGGWPRGRIIEIFGPESGGKTTLCLHAIAEFQEAFSDEDVAVVDVEHSFDKQYAAALGVDVDTLLLNQPDYGEQALNVTRLMIQQGVGLVVVDSLAALVPKAELEGDIGDQYMGLQARMMSQSLRMLTPEAGKRNSTIIFTNQIREKIGQRYGPTTTTPGGRAMRFYTTIRVNIKSIGKDEKKGEKVLSNKVQADVVKNKVASPYATAVFSIRFGEGIDLVSGVFDKAVEWGLIEKSGSWYSLGELRLGQGKAKAMAMLRENEDLFNQVKEGMKVQHTTKKKAKKVERVPVPEPDEDEETEEEEVTVEDG